MDKQHMKFSALSVDFDSPSLDFLNSRKPAHEGIKEQYPCKSCDEMAGERLTVCEQEPVSYTHLTLPTILRV